MSEHDALFDEIYYGPGGMMGATLLYETAVKTDPTVTMHEARE